MLLHYLEKQRNTKIAFSLKHCISALPEFNQLLDFFNLFDSWLILTLLYDSVSLIINAFSYRQYSGHSSRDRKSVALQQYDFVAHTIHLSSRLTETDTPTIRLGATPSGLTSAHLHHPPCFYRPDALPATQPTVSKHWRQLAHSD